MIIIPFCPNSPKFPFVPRVSKISIQARSSIVARQQIAIIASATTWYHSSSCVHTQLIYFVSTAILYTSARRRLDRIDRLIRVDGGTAVVAITVFRSD